MTESGFNSLNNLSLKSPSVAHLQGNRVAQGESKLVQPRKAAVAVRLGVRPDPSSIPKTCTHTREAARQPETGSRPPVQGVWLGVGMCAASRPALRGRWAFSLLLLPDPEGGRGLCLNHPKERATRGPGASSWAVLRTSLLPTTALPDTVLSWDPPKARTWPLST